MLDDEQVLYVAFVLGALSISVAAGSGLDLVPISFCFGEMAFSVWVIGSHLRWVLFVIYLFFLRLLSYVECQGIKRG